MNKNEKFVITINRELGSGGRTIGEILAHKLGVPFYDKALIKALEEKYNLTAEEIEKMRGREIRWWEGFKRIAGIGIRTTQYINTYPAYAPAWHIWGKFFVEGNVNATYADVTEDNWANGMYNQIDASGCDGTYTAVTKDTIKIDEPIPFILTTTHSADVAYERVLDYAGASRFRDSHDALMVSDTHDRTATYRGRGNSPGFINSQDDAGGWPTLAQTAAKNDTDGDGMPDEWETANGLNPNDASDGNITGADGYTNLEVYLNALVAEITQLQNEGGETWSGQQTTGIHPIVCRDSVATNYWYNLQGCRIINPSKGVYIQNGKKIVIR